MTRSSELKDLLGPTLIGTGVGLAVGAASGSWIAGVVAAIVGFTTFLAASKKSSESSRYHRDHDQT